MPPDSYQLYLITPRLRGDNFAAFALRLKAALASGQVASVMARLAPEAEGDAKRILAALLEITMPANVALLAEKDARLAARAGADGAHVDAGDLAAALESLKPERIVGAGGLRLRDDAMTAGEAGADYVMFGEPRPDGWTPPLAETLERVEWWAEIFQTPCVAYAATLDAVAPLAAAGADFIALDGAVWDAPSPETAVAQAYGHASARA